MTNVASAANSNAHPSRPTLVVVDDEPSVLDSVRDLFRKEFSVYTFENATEALAALGDLVPAVVLTDQRMPGMTGVEFLGHVKRLHPDATRLMFTGYADIKAVIDAINEGHVFRYLGKPWEPEELEVVIRQAVEHHHLLVDRRRLVAELRASNTRLEESNHLKKAFIEVASHELNTPVAVILGMTDLWGMIPPDAASATQAAWLQRIQTAGRRLAGTVERMLKLLRADQFDEPLALQPTEVESLIRRATTGIQPFLEVRDQRIELRIESEIGSAEVDPAKVGDILTNLLINAIKFTPDGGVIVVSAESDGPDFVRFHVADTGIGISPADRPHLFEPFFTGYDTLHHSSGDFQYGKKGIGLGLSLVKSFVEMHGGSVEVVSEPAAGSTFGFRLPRRPVRKSGASGSRPIPA